MALDTERYYVFLHYFPFVICTRCIFDTTALMGPIFGFYNSRLTFLDFDNCLGNYLEEALSGGHQRYYFIFPRYDFF